MNLAVALLAICSAGLLQPQAAFADPTQATSGSGTATLTGLNAFGCMSNGTYQTFDFNTIGGDVADNLYVAQGGRSGPFLNSGDGATTSLDLPLTPGTYTYSIFGDDYFDFSPVQSFGLNLFFDGSTLNPSLSVFAPISTTTTPGAFSADSKATPFLGPFTSTTATTVNGAGTLGFIDGSESISLTSYSWSSPSVYSLDRVSNHSTTPNGYTDFVGQFTLNVSAVPEPSSVVLLTFMSMTAISRRQRVGGPNS